VSILSRTLHGDRGAIGEKTQGKGWGGAIFRGKPRLATTGRQQLFPHSRSVVYPRLDGLLPLIGLELKRARRYERPLSAVAFELDEQLVLPRLRATDIVAASPRHKRLLVVLPEAGPEAVVCYAERVELDTGVRPVRAASFPDDALTLDVLLRLVLED
jgi:hypothetical protein